MKKEERSELDGRVADVRVYGSVDGWVWEAAAVHALLSPLLIEFIMCPSLWVW